MKKGLFPVLSVLLVGMFLIAGCAQGTAEEAPAAEEAVAEEAAPVEEEASVEEEEDLVFASVVKSIGDTWFVRFEEGAKKFGEDYGVTAFMEGPSQPDSAAQVAVIDDLIAQGVNAIVNVPYGVPENETVQKKAIEEGIVVIGHEAESAAAGSLTYDLEAFDNCAYGEELISELAARMNEEGEYVQFVGSLTNSTHSVWTECALEYQKANYPNMELVGKFESKENAENGYNIMKDILKTNPEVKGVQSSDSVEIQGIARAIEEAGLVDEINVIGICIVSDVGDYIASGAIDLSMLWDPADAAYAANVLAYKIYKGEEIVDGMDLGVPGWEEITITEGANGVPVIYGKAFAKISAENMDQFDF